MKQIKAQLSYDILKNILPLSAIDSTREILTTAETAMLFDLWKCADKNDRVAIPLDANRTVIASLKYKGYVDYNGPLFNFTKRGREVIKQIILSKEENTFEKKAKK